METTKTRGPIPGGLILTHSHMVDGQAEKLIPNHLDDFSFFFPVHVVIIAQTSLALKPTMLRREAEPRSPFANLKNQVLFWLHTVK